MKSTPEELMLQYQNGSTEAFHQLYQLYSGQVYRYIFRLAKNQQESADLFQKVWLKFHQSRFRYQNRFAVSQWLFVMAKSAFLDRVRSIQRDRRLQEDWASEQSVSESESPNVEDWNDIVQQSELLSDDQKIVIQLRVHDELSFQEIANRLGKPEAALRKVLSRAIVKLKKEVS